MTPPRAVPEPIGVASWGALWSSNTYFLPLPPATQPLPVSGFLAGHLLTRQLRVGLMVPEPLPPLHSSLPVPGVLIYHAPHQACCSVREINSANGLRLFSGSTPFGPLQLPRDPVSHSVPFWLNMGIDTHLVYSCSPNTGHRHAAASISLVFSRSHIPGWS